MKPWKNDNENQMKEDRRSAAKAFLEKAASDKDLRKAITGLGNRAEAQKQFRALGDIDIPANVEVICLEKNLSETSGRDDLVVFILPDLDESEPIDPLEHWVAAWPPY